MRFDKAAEEDEFLPEGSTGPFRYPVSKTGYYCVGAVPVTFEQPQLDMQDKNSSNPFSEVSYTGVVDFENVFKGHLPAAEYPKIGVRVICPNGVYKFAQIAVHRSSMPF